jgi:transposase-like protein
VQEDGAMPKKIDPAVKERAVKLVLEHQAEYPSLFAAITAVAKQQRLGVESLLRPVESRQYTSIALTEHLGLEGISPSIGSVGDAYDC